MENEMSRAAEKHYVLPNGIDAWSLTSLQQRLVKSGGRRNPGKGYAVKNLAKELKAEAVRYKLSLGWEVKTDIPAYL